MNMYLHFYQKPHAQFTFLWNMCIFAGALKHMKYIDFNIKCIFCK